MAVLSSNDALSILQEPIDKLTSVGWSQSSPLNENLGSALDLLENWVVYHDDGYFKKQLLATKALVEKYNPETLIAKASNHLSKHTLVLPENDGLVSLTGMQRYFLNCYLRADLQNKSTVDYMAYRLRNIHNPHQTLVEGDWVEFFNTAPAIANLLLKQPLLAIHRHPQVGAAGNLFYSYEMPEFWSKEQSFWIYSRRPPEMTLRGKNTFLADQAEFDFLWQIKVINKPNPVHRIAVVDFAQPLQMNWHDRLDIKPHKSSRLGIEMEIYYCHLLILILCAGVVNSKKHKQFGAECYLNLKRMQQVDVVRAFTCLLTLHCNMNEQNWVMLPPDGCLHTLLGLKPRFLVKVTKNIHHITKELVSLGYVPNVKQYSKISPQVGTKAPLTTAMTSLSCKQLQEHTSQLLSLLHPNSINQ